MIFAETSPDPQSFTQWWIIVGFVASTLCSVGTLIAMLRNKPQKNEISPQPLLIKLEENFVDRKTFQQLAEVVERNRQEDKVGRDKIYGEIKSIRIELSEKIETQSAEFGQAFRDMPSQIVTLLKNTGALNK